MTLSPAATVLALNVGSSSLKARVRRDDDTVAIHVERMGTEAGLLTLSGHNRPRQSSPFRGALTQALEAVADLLTKKGYSPKAVGHRVVHGGGRYNDPVIVDQNLLTYLDDITALAPLHLPGNILALRIAMKAWPAATHVACFDTAFHRELPDVSVRLPVPERVDALGVRRYGFRGLSIRSVLDQLSFSGETAGNLVLAHLGSGCSVTAVDATGRSQHTTMSMTPTSGIMSATRTGDLDPEVALLLIQRHGYTVDDLRRFFDQECGLAGVSGGTHDMRDLLRAADEGDDLAQLAIDMFVQSVAMGIASCATTLDSWETLVFTGGVGEHDVLIRDQICSRLAVITPKNLEIKVIPADEESVIDRFTRTTA